MIHVFVGPTLAAKTVLELLPDAHLCPPVRHGDLFRLEPDPGDIVAIIDGLFHHEIAIRHKEILAILDRGVHVCGASSMGALRAAELHPYGMKGIGSIFAMLVSGEIEGDDEVSLIHADATDGYLPLTEALVDIRLHCRQAVKAGVVTETEADTIVAAAGELAYDERAYARVLGLATEHGLMAPASAAYLDFVRGEGGSAKRDDALALVHDLCDGAPAGPHEPFALSETQWLHHWRASLTGSRDAAGRFVSDRVVLNFIRIVARDYPAFHERVALEELAAFHGEELGLAVPPARELIDDFRRTTGFQDEQVWHAWCAERQLGEEDLATSLQRAARVRALTGSAGEVSSSRLRELAGEYAVALGLWREDDAPVTQIAPWLTVRERGRLSSLEQVARMAVRTFRIYPDAAHDKPFVVELKRSGTFARACAILAQRPPLPEARPRATAVLDWCAMRWGVHAVGPLDILDRGLDSASRHGQGRSLPDALVARARRFYGRVEDSGDFPLLSVVSEAQPLLGAAFE